MSTELDGSKNEDPGTEATPSAPTTAEETPPTAEFPPNDADGMETDSTGNELQPPATGSEADSVEEQNPVQAHVPQFANLESTPQGVKGSNMSRFLDVSVQVSAELGSVRMPIGEVLHLGEGSVIELNRNLSEPIDLIAQGVRIARGEVVVIDECFAIRIKEIESNQITE